MSRPVLAALVVIVLIPAAIASPAAAHGLGNDAPPTASISGLAGNLVNSATGGGDPIDVLSAGAGSLAGVALGVFASGVLGGAGSALQETAHVISQTTAPRLQSTWFSGTYWRVSALAALLSLPFLFAAAVQALVRADPMLLARSVLGFLPIAVIAVNLAAPTTMLLLSATDEMSSVVAGAGMGGGVHFLQQTAQIVTGLGALDGSPFLGIVVGLLTLAAAIALAVEMLIREAAVYVVVLMLPLAFAALIWPARRRWAVRLIELLVSLILSKFVIVAVLSLAGAAYGGSGAPTVTRLLTAMALVMLSTFAPWVMLRLLPFTELAAGAAGGIRGELPHLAKIPQEARRGADTVAGWAESLPNLLGRQAAEPEPERIADHLVAAGIEPEGGDHPAPAGIDPDIPVVYPAGPSGEGAGTTPRPGSGDPAIQSGNSRAGGPWSQMESVWQFEDLTPNWMALDADGVSQDPGSGEPVDPLPPATDPEAEL
jgi:hypothetical protein